METRWTRTSQELRLMLHKCEVKKIWKVVVGKNTLNQEVGSVQVLKREVSAEVSKRRRESSEPELIEIDAPELIEIDAPELIEIDSPEGADQGSPRREHLNIPFPSVEEGKELEVCGREPHDSSRMTLHGDECSVIIDLTGFETIDERTSHENVELTLRNSQIINPKFRDHE